MTTIIRTRTRTAANNDNIDVKSKSKNSDNNKKKTNRSSPHLDIFAGGSPIRAPPSPSKEAI